MKTIRPVFASHALRGLGACCRMFVIWVLQVVCTEAAVYYVTPDGDDNHAGSRDRPWRTIQRAASQAQPGDVVYVLSGIYAERVTTVRGGASESNRIVFQAIGTVVMRGWIINHPYITVDGFDITDHTHPSNVEAYVRVNNGGAYFQLLSCTIRDGRAIKREDVIFRAPNRIESPLGGFVAAGFQPGQSIVVMRGTNVAISNRASYVVAEVHENALIVLGTNIVDDGPKVVYITGSPNYGVVLWGGTKGCVLRNNRFSNLSYRYVLIQGVDHIIENNVFENNNGWDIIHWAGTNHVIRGNLFRNLGWGVYEPSPDVFDNWPVRYERIYFTNNMVLRMIGVINAQKLNSTAGGPLYIRNNVFVDVGWLSVVMPNSFVEHNTFVRVGREGNVAVQVEQHPVIIRSDNYASNAVVRNNIFVDCGQATGQARPEQVGWYRFTGPHDTAVVGGNFVAGGPPEFKAKEGWPESPELNGGDPGFVNMDDPLGPDGLPFTADDGLRLRPDSKLLGAGVGGATIGAYELPYVQQISLEIVVAMTNEIHLWWPESVWTWRLECSTNLSGPWRPAEVVPRFGGTGWHATVQATGTGLWFRLVRP